MKSGLKRSVKYLLLKVYLNDINDTEDQVLEKVFFVYRLINAWVKRLNDHNYEKIASENLIPAIQYMENITKLLCI